MSGLSQDGGCSWDWSRLSRRSAPHLHRRHGGDPVHGSRVESQRRALAADRRPHDGLDEAVGRRRGGACITCCQPTRPDLQHSWCEALGRVDPAVDLLASSRANRGEWTACSGRKNGAPHPLPAFAVLVGAVSRRRAAPTSREASAGRSPKCPSPDGSETGSRPAWRASATRDLLAATTAGARSARLLPARASLAVQVVRSVIALVLCFQFAVRRRVRRISVVCCPAWRGRRSACHLGW